MPVICTPEELLEEWIMSPVEAHPWTDPIVEEVRAVRDAIAARQWRR